MTDRDPQDEDYHWYFVILPQLMEEARSIQNVINGVVACKSSPHYRTIGVRTLLRMWDQQYQSLLVFADGTEPPLGDQLHAILAERQEAMSKLRKRLWEVKGWQEIDP